MAVQSQQRAMVSAPALTAEGLGKTFGSKVAFADVSFERLAKLSSATDRTEASLLREALDDLLDKHKDAL
jgi:hypothetical protein